VLLFPKEHEEMSQVTPSYGIFHKIPDPIGSVGP